MELNIEINLRVPYLLEQIDNSMSELTLKKYDCKSYINVYFQILRQSDYICSSTSCRWRTWTYPNLGRQLTLRWVQCLGLKSNTFSTNRMCLCRNWLWTNCSTFRRTHFLVVSVSCPYLINESYNHYWFLIVRQFYISLVEETKSIWQNNV